MNKNAVWNLTSEEWSRVLKTGDEPDLAARDIRQGRVLPWVRILLDYCVGSVSVLDLGSGAGQNSAMLALHGKKTTLLDWSKENIEFSIDLYYQLGIKGEFHNLDMTKKLPFADNSFDTVFSCGVFEYFSDAQIVSILGEAFRVAKDRVIIMVPNAASVPYRLGMWYLKKTRKWQWGGERPHMTLKPYFKNVGRFKVREFTVATKHSLNFLKMPLGNFIKKALIMALRLKDHPKPSFLRQGYLLVSIAEKTPC